VVTLGIIENEPLRLLITSERVRLEEEALDVAAELFSESPRKWCKRVRGWVVERLEGRSEC
jgi:hypothetical protein